MSDRPPQDRPPQDRPPQDRPPQDHAPRGNYPDDPVSATPQEVASSRDASDVPDRPKAGHPDVDLTSKADTTKQASVEPTD